uniref:Uncharacterized protein n=1 Tax=Neospora caninum (strain Liverpool) TaxID=572307 RepID=A0A0F7U8D2_NEOCL|nr:TPA: hypothetical protein BN1204_019150 [Neospora caninum Liverpool]
MPQTLASAASLPSTGLATPALEEATTRQSKDDRQEGKEEKAHAESEGESEAESGEESDEKLEEKFQAEDGALKGGPPPFLEDISPHVSSSLSLSLSSSACRGEQPRLSTTSETLIGDAPGSSLAASTARDGSPSARSEEGTAEELTSPISCVRPVSSCEKRENECLSQEAQAAHLPAFLSQAEPSVPASLIGSPSSFSSFSSFSSASFSFFSSAHLAKSEKTRVLSHALEEREAVPERDVSTPLSVISRPVSLASSLALSAGLPVAANKEASLKSSLMSFFSPPSFPSLAPASSSASSSVSSSPSSSRCSSSASSFPSASSGVEGVGDAGTGARETAREKPVRNEGLEMRAISEEGQLSEEESLSPSFSHPRALSVSCPSSYASGSLAPSPCLNASEEKFAPRAAGLRTAFAEGRFGRIFQRFGSLSSGTALISRSSSSAVSSSSFLPASDQVSSSSSSSSSRSSSSSSAVSSSSSSLSAYSSSRPRPGRGGDELEREESDLFQGRKHAAAMSLVASRTRAQGAPEGAEETPPSDFVLQPPLLSRLHPRAVAEDPNFFPSPHDERAQMLILMELSRLRGEMLQLQLATASKPANIIIQNKTEVAASTETNIQQSARDEEPRSRFLDCLSRFFSSRVNQFVLLCGVGLGCYMLLEHWRHTWRMAQLRRRVDSNIVLRGVQMLEETIGVRRPSSIF